MFTYNIIAARCAQAIHVHAAIFLRRRCDRILFGLIVRIARLGYEPEAAERAAPRTNLFQLCMRHRPRAARLCILDPRRLSVARRDAAHSASRGTQSDTWLIDAALPLFISRRIENAALADWRLRVAGLDGICPGIAFCRWPCIAIRFPSGMTPSAYRAQAQAGTPILPTKQTLTES